ncbi:chemotaxis protein CheW [Defluviimonas sp. WL0050]|uniref:Chemotaxis protein CheW n=1 Tax=Albidovulum litorale TaxID=2984134 RepID=A0ABT2ZRG3_9RHOB|nr:chemotaxis protein CheW [Defluviimonas sp. WL0050]MCV2873346.1 chemotaxis protein CheW [Defluviimonas sp. WL0050]
MSDAGEIVELLAFRLGEERFCVDVTAVRELRSWGRPTPLPHAPAYLSGVINLRGTILPVLDLATRLGLPPLAGGDRNVIIVAEAAGQSAGLIVDAVSDIHRVERGALEAPPAMASDGQTVCISALSLIGDQMVRVLDLAALLSTTVVDAA